MSWLKAALAVGAVAAAGYATYKVAKKHPKAVKAVVDVLAKPSPTRVYTETVVVVEEPVVSKPLVVVRQEEVVWEAEADKMEGVMSVAKQVQDHDGELTIDIEDGSVVVTQTRHSAKELDYLDTRDGGKLFGRRPLDDIDFPSMTRH